MKDMPTIDQAKAYQAAYDFFNVKLFDNKLPRCMLTMSRNANLIGGYFAPQKWFDEDKEEIGEIAINANVLKQTGIVKAMGILIHEMAHHWQHSYGKPTRGGYHNKEWVAKCKEIGLQPYGTKGEECGQSIDTKLIEGGRAQQAIVDLPEEDLFPWMSEPTDEPVPQGGGGGGGREQVPIPKKGKRTKYTCPVCGWNLWGKSGGNFLCLADNTTFVEMQGGQDNE